MLLLFKEQPVYSTTFGGNVWLPRNCQTTCIKWSPSWKSWPWTKNAYAQVIASILFWWNLHRFFSYHFLDSVKYMRCGLLRSMTPKNGRLSVCLPVAWVNRKNGSMDWGPAWGGDSWGPKKHQKQAYSFTLRKTKIIRLFVFSLLLAVLFGRIRIHYSAYYSAWIEYE